MTDTLARLGSALAGRYAIERELGAGGMATVYLAQDVRHDRRVALKVLRPELAAVIGAERFLAEIKTTANLQHPHILALFDSGEADGFLFYVMPYVEGESLRDRLNHEKQLPVADAVRIASEVASALDYAHRHHVIHRDIKPENILLHDGQALVADFGIALAVSTAGSTRMTETGMSLGTPFYMSPEQAMGEREVTARSDVYALGAVLYEMLTGEPPFTGPTAQAIIAKVVTEEPRPLVPKRHTVPPHLEAAVLTALEKLAADRFASAADFAAALQDPGYRGTAGARAAVSERLRSAPHSMLHRLVLPVVALAGVLLGTIVAWLLRPSPHPPVIRYGLAMPAAQAPNPTWGGVPSPDGSRIAYVGPGESGGQLWIKDRDRYEARALPGAQGVVNFTWSPDGEWIAYTEGRTVRKLPSVGGAPIAIADSASGNPGLAWLDDGTIVYTRAGGTGFRSVPANGGVSTEIYSDSGSVGKPTPLPDARGVLFIRCSGSCNTSQELWALDMRNGKAHQVAPGVALGQYLPTGHLMTIRPDGAMFVTPFDLKRLVVSGSPIPIADSVSVVNGVLPLAAVSANGTLVMRRGAALSLLQWYQMVWIDRAGRETAIDPSWKFRLTNYGANYGWSVSPDGSRLAIGLFTDAGDDIWIKQLPRGPLSRVSFDSASEFRPRWMADGRTVMFSSNRQGRGTGGLYLRRADGTGEDSLLLRAPAGIYEGAWSPDGRWLVLRTGGTIGMTGGRDIVGIRPGVDSAPVPVIATRYDEEAIAISPNGRWLAYESNETGRTEVFLRPFPNTESGKRQVSNGGGLAPLWSRDGRELFYVDGNRDMMTVSVAQGDDPRLGEPRRLFQLDDRIYMSTTEFYTPYDVGPDGRFIMARNVTEASEIEVPLIVVENWFEEVRQKVGGQ